MSETLLFAIGVVVFALTVVASLWYGYFTFSRVYEASILNEPSHLPSTERLPLATQPDASVDAS